MVVRAAGRQVSIAGTMSEPIAYLITIRTYGTWLPGDERGWVQKHDTVYRSPFLAPRTGLRRNARAVLRHAPTLLGRGERAIVICAIRGVCANRTWDLLALNVLSNHVHIVLSARERPEELMRVLNAWCTRRLRESDATPRDNAVWSRHGSTVYLWSESQVASACDYVRHSQGERDSQPGPLVDTRGTDKRTARPTQPASGPLVDTRGTDQRTARQTKPRPSSFADARGTEVG